MGFYELEPFGDVVADLRTGSVASVIANIKRDPEKKKDPYLADDFIFWRDTGERDSTDDEPVLLEDPVEQSNLLRAALFGKAPR